MSSPVLKPKSFTPKDIRIRKRGRKGSGKVRNKKRCSELYLLSVITENVRSLYTKWKNNVYMLNKTILFIHVALCVSLKFGCHAL